MSRKTQTQSSPSGNIQPPSDTEMEKMGMDDRPVKVFTPRVFAMVMLVSIGGLIFGYDTGQISGFLEMNDFLKRFGNTTVDGKAAFTDVRSGTIVGLLSIGTLIGALGSAPIADLLGRRIAIIVGNLIFIVGVIVQITTETHWYQIAVGRWVAGLGVGMLSILTPMYQSETAPRQIRGALVSAYQLFITLGIFLADCINFGTANSAGARQWRLPMGIGFIWPVIMASGILFLRESPRWDYRKGRVDAARKTIALSYHVPENHWEVQREMDEIKEKFDEENAPGAKHSWLEVFTGPRMFYRVALGVGLQALQQLTGANYFFYYATSIFSSVGINNSFVTAMILGGVNFGMTFPGLWIVERFGRRRVLITGALWMFMCFMVFASVGGFSLNINNPGATPTSGTVLIVFACLFIAGYAPSWGPIVWAVIGELYPTRTRATAMGIATASNWIWNFLIAFFTPFITKDINYKYGYVFAGCNLAAAFVVYFFLLESRGRSLEEIDTMYVLHVSPFESSKWAPPRHLRNGDETIDPSAVAAEQGGLDAESRKSEGDALGRKSEGEGLGGDETRRVEDAGVNRETEL